MRLVIQRVLQASVTVEARVVGEIGPGLLILCGVGRGDSDADAHWLARKTVQLRIFEDDAGKMNRSLIEAGGHALVVSQFTLYADCRKGNRPSFIDAAPPEEGDRLYRVYVAALRELGIHVQTGIFRAMMSVALINDGPVTLMLDSAQRNAPA